MKLGSVKYLVGEGLKNTWVNRLMSLASVGVLVACMVVSGLAILISENVSIALGRLEEQNVAMVYMQDYSWALYGDKSDTDTTSSDESSIESNSSEDDESSNTSSTTSKNESKDEKDSTESDDSENTSEESSTKKEEPDKNGILYSDYAIHNEEEAHELCDRIAALDNVIAVEFVSSEEGLASITDNMLEGQEEYFSFLDDEYGNPLSMAAKVTVDPEFFEPTIKAITELEGVDIVRSQGDLAEKITAIKNGIAIAGFWIIAILLLISLIIVSNTIRITMYNRKLEISIMKAVGATDTFIRIPFIVEGMTIGLISALISEGVLYFCYRVATETIAATLGTNDIIKYGEVAWQLLAVFAIIGVGAGAIGSFIMIGKYLRKEGSEFSAI